MIGLLIEQDHAPIPAVRIIDQYKRHIRPVLLIEAAVFHLTIERIAHLVLAVAVPDPGLDPPFHARPRHQRQRLAVQHDRLAHVEYFVHFQCSSVRVK